MPDAASALPDTEAGGNIYERDEQACIGAQVAALISGRLQDLDRTTSSECLVKMTICDRRELQSRPTELLMHLLTMHYQPERPTRSWIKATLMQQNQIRLLLGGVSSLDRQVDTIVATAYPNAASRAACETDLSIHAFLPVSPWTVAGAFAFDPPEPATREARH